MVSRGEGLVGEFGMNMCTLLYLKWITNTVLLDGTGNSARCGSLDRKGLRGIIDTCVYMAESLCCPPESVTTLLMSI